MASVTPKFLKDLRVGDLKLLLRSRKALVSGKIEKLKTRLRDLLLQAKVEDPDSFDFGPELSQETENTSNEPRKRLDITADQKIRIVAFLRDEYHILYGELSNSLQKHVQQKKWIDFVQLAQE